MSYQTNVHVIPEGMSMRVEVPPYRQMVYSSNGGSRLAAGHAKQFSKDGRTPANMMGPLGRVKAKPWPWPPSLPSDLPNFN